MYVCCYLLMNIKLYKYTAIYLFILLLMGIWVFLLWRSLYTFSTCLLVEIKHEVLVSVGIVVIDALDADLSTLAPIRRLNLHMAFLEIHDV